MVRKHIAIQIKNHKSHKTQSRLRFWREMILSAILPLSNRWIYSQHSWDVSYWLYRAKKQKSMHVYIKSDALIFHIWFIWGMTLKQLASHKRDIKKNSCCEISVDRLPSWGFLKNAQTQQSNALWNISLCMNYGQADFKASQRGAASDRKHFDWLCHIFWFKDQHY